MNVISSVGAGTFERGHLTKNPKRESDWNHCDPGNEKAQSGSNNNTGGENWFEDISTTQTFSKTAKNFGLWGGDFRRGKR